MSTQTQASQYKVTKTSGTWLGNVGEMVTTRKSNRKTSERVVAIRWPNGHNRDGLSPGDVQVSHVIGDGRDDSFEQFDAKVISNGTDEQIAAYVNERLGA